MNIQNLQIGFLVFKDYTPLDLVGPYEVLSRVGQCFLVSETKEVVTTSKGFKIVPDFDFTDAPDFDLLIVPGGVGQTPAMLNERLIAFIQERSNQSTYVGGVCTGTLLLAKAGILSGKKAATHWLARHELQKFNCSYSQERVIWSDGKIITGAGVSAGIDLALVLIEKIFGEKKAKEVQLAIEYDPAPPHDTGSPDKAPADIVEKLIRESRFKDSWSIKI